MTRTAVLAALRAPVAPRGGALVTLDIEDLAAPVIRACLDRAGLSPRDVDELILGNALGAGGNPARRAALSAGLPLAVGGLTIDRQCVSGLDAILLGDALIRSGAARIVVAGGAESYSLRPLRARGTRTDPEFYDRPAFAPAGYPDPDLAEAADTLARDTAITRAEMDAFAVASHQRARAADPMPEIVPLAGLARDSFTRDLRPGAVARAPVLHGDVTAASAAVAADGAAFVVLGPARDHPGRPTIRAAATRGGDPARPGLAPLAAVEEVCATVGIAPGDIPTIEIMEAYASQAIATIRAAGFRGEAVNRGGGALARGHPIGASGAILAARLIAEAERRGGLALAAIAAAGGLGTALLIEV